MSKKNRNRDQQKTSPDSQQANSQTDGGTKIGPKLDSATSKTAAQNTTQQGHPTQYQDWHRPLGIPITEWLVAFFTLVIMSSSIVYTIYARETLIKLSPFHNRSS